jgi:hypothetical protein
MTGKAGRLQIQEQGLMTCGPGSNSMFGDGQKSDGIVAEYFSVRVGTEPRQRRPRAWKKAIELWSDWIYRDLVVASPVSSPLLAEEPLMSVRNAELAGGCEDDPCPPLERAGPKDKARPRDAPPEWAMPDALVGP